MTQFSKLIGITMEHGYYKNVTGKFRIAPTAKTETLMRNRGYCSGRPMTVASG
ncbi:MAG: hypothetical protein LUI85_14625 [Bacteroides sp.]|nr:hypothetical protein [Bacteroides sp.]